MSWLDWSETAIWYIFKIVFWPLFAGIPVAYYTFDRVSFAIVDFLFFISDSWQVAIVITMSIVTLLCVALGTTYVVVFWLTWPLNAWVYLVCGIIISAFFEFLLMEVVDG